MRRQRLGLVLVAASLASLVPATNAEAAPRCFGRRATIVGTHDDDRLVGTRGRDVFFGRAGDDVIIGRGGNDRICGGLGEDDLRGGGGNDRISSGGGDPSGRGATLRGGGGHDVLLGSLDGETLFGGAGNDILRASDSNRIYTDALYGGLGDDVLAQGAEGAYLVPGPGDDRVDGGDDDFTRTPDGRHLTDPDILEFSSAPGPLSVDLQKRIATGEGTDEIVNVERVHGSAFDDTIVGGGPSCCETLYGLGGDDILAGAFGDDVLIGDLPPESDRYEAHAAGNDTLIGADGNDSLRGGEGDDEYVGGEGQDTVLFTGSDGAVTADLTAGTASGEGADTMRGVDNLTGSAFADSLVGDEGDNRLEGGNGADSVRGVGGNDTLVTDGIGGEANHLEGGTGSDTVAYVCLSFRSSTDADLQAGTDSLGNVLLEIENISGNCPGTFSGTEGPNRIDASGQLYGRGGDDVLIGGTRDDLLNGGDGTDVLDGGLGTDTCIEGETLIRCER